MAIMIAAKTQAKPAFLGGEPLFAQPLGFVKPCLPDLKQVEAPLLEILTSGRLTNGSRFVTEFERSLSERLGAPHVLATANATLGLVLALSALDLTGEVILPSFTFSATAHSLYWNRLEPVFADILPDTFTLDPAAVEAAVTPRTSAILAVHIYGHPCEIGALSAVARRHGLALLFDAAHAFGSTINGHRVGIFGEAEVFSFHATKILPVGEGGCIVTRRSDLAEKVALLRKFGDPGNENTVLCGLNAKMQEINGALGLAGLETIDAHLANRRRYARYLIERLGHVPGIRFQAVWPGVSVNHQNFPILVEAEEFGLRRDELYLALEAENIQPRRYFYPPLHCHPAYRRCPSPPLPVTKWVADRVLCLPFYSQMSEEMLDRLCLAVEQAQAFSPAIRQALVSGWNGSGSA